MGLDVGEIRMGADLSLDLRYSASRAMKQIKNAPASDTDAYIRRLEEERGKIEAFRRELPICARLVADVIDVLKEEAERKKNGRQEEDGAGGDKSEWMSTAQLWTGGSGRGGAEPEKRDKSCAVTPFEAVGSSGAPAFGRPWLGSGDKAADAGVADLSLPPPPPVITSVPAAAGAADESRRQVVGFAEAAARAASVAPSSGPAVGLQPQPQQRQTTPPQQARKSRRCWSPELHRQFVAALNQLGGPQVATPKQIREVMKVDGLTNDEVKSHLQKYRLHNRSWSWAGCGSLLLTRSRGRAAPSPGRPRASPSLPAARRRVAAGPRATAGNDRHQPEEQRKGQGSPLQLFLDRGNSGGCSCIQKKRSR